MLILLELSGGRGRVSDLCVVAGVVADNVDSADVVAYIVGWLVGRVGRKLACLRGNSMIGGDERVVVL